MTLMPQFQISLQIFDYLQIKNSMIQHSINNNTNIINIQNKMRKIPRDFIQIPTQPIRSRLLPFDEISRISYIAQQKPLLKMLSPRKQLSQSKNQQKIKTVWKVNDPSYQPALVNRSIFKEICHRLDKRFPIFKPYSTFIYVWNFVTFFTIIYQFMQIPITLLMGPNAYISQMNNPILLSINIITILILTFDTFFLKLNLAYYQNGFLIKSRQNIIKTYLFSISGFILDFIAWFVMISHVGLFHHQTIYLKLLFYVKLPALIKTDEQIAYSLISHRIRICLFNFTRIILMLWFITTWVSSIFFAIDYQLYNSNSYYKQTQQLWLTNTEYINSTNLITSYPWYIWYQYAAYWSVQTSSACGYGNILPRNPPEVLYCNIIIIINTLFFAFYINSIWQIIGQLTENSNNYSQICQNLKIILSGRRMPLQVNIKVSEFLRQTWLAQHNQFYEQQLLTALTFYQKKDLSYEVHMQFFKNIPLFDCLNTFSKTWLLFIKQISHEITQQKICQGQNIFVQQQPTQSLFYLITGKILCWHFYQKRLTFWIRIIYHQSIQILYCTCAVILYLVETLKICLYFATQKICYFIWILLLTQIKSYYLQLSTSLQHKMLEMWLNYPFFQLLHCTQQMAIKHPQTPVLKKKPTKANKHVKKETQAFINPSKQNKKSLSTN